MAESLGFDDFYLPDQDYFSDPFPLLALCAERTQTIRLGLAVTNPFSRNVVQVARSAAVLADLSGGRFLLGYGAGNANMLRQLGITRSRTLSSVRSAILVTRSLLSGETVHWDGPGLRLDGVRLKCLSEHHVPLFLGTHGEKMLRLAGEIADGVFLEGLLSQRGYTFAEEQLEDGAVRGARASEAIEKVTWVRLGLSDRPDVAEDVEYQSWARLLLSSVPEEVQKRLGLRRDAAPRYESASGERGALSPEVVRSLLLLGSPEEVRNRLEAAKSWGVRRVGVIIFGAYEDVVSSMERFSKTVMQQPKG